MNISRLIVMSVYLAKFAVCSVMIGSCTSIGQQSRATPKIAKPTSQFAEIGFDGDDNELSVGIEKLLESRGVKVTILSTPQVRQQRGDKEYTFDEVQTRYVLRIRSTDLDRCLPEGSRQMHFHLSVVDFQERSRVFLMSGEYGCLDTLIKNFEQWLSTQTRPGPIVPAPRTLGSR